jgi:hypothetical protein
MMMIMMISTHHHSLGDLMIDRLLLRLCCKCELFPHLHLMSEVHLRLHHRNMWHLDLHHLSNPSHINHRL